MMVTSGDRTAGQRPPIENHQRLAFGPFVLDRVARTLTRDRKPVRLRSREMDILLYLVVRAGQIVSRDELIGGIWPTASVSEANMRVQIAGLKRALSDTAPGEIGSALDRDAYIQDVNDQGYLFAATVRPLLHGQADDAPAPAPAASSSPRRPPSKALIGREADLAELRAALTAHRLVTLTGDIGIGKTALALALADTAGDVHADGVRFVDLSPLPDPRWVVSAISMAMEMKGSGPGTRLEDRLIKRLAPLDLLLILDHCDHLDEGVVAAVTLILERTHGVRVLITRRQSLGHEAEHLFAVAPLALAPDAPLAALSRRLGGNPLAIELAANPRVLQDLDAIPAHEGALVDHLLDLSYAGLAAREQRLIRNLSIFRSDFTLVSADAVAGELFSDPSRLEPALAALVAGSLLTIDDRQAPAKYRLPGPVRDFAYRRLTASGDFATVAARHAERLLAIIRTSAEGEIGLGLNSLLHDIRAAIDWAFSGQGDPLAGMQLTSSAIEIGRHLPILADYTQDIDRAIAHLERVPDLEPKLVLRLLVERISVHMHLEHGMDGWHDLTDRATRVARTLYETTRNPADLFEIKLTLYSKAFGEADGPGMRQMADDLRQLAVESDRAESMQITLDRTQAQALHFNGRHQACLATVGRILAYTDEAIRQRYFLPGDRLDQRMTIRIFQARSLWLTGRGAAATEAALTALDMARGDFEYISCYILAFSVIPIHFWRGDMTAAVTATSELFRLAGEGGLSYWENWGICYQQALNVHGYGDPGRVPPGFSPVLAIRSDHLAAIHDAFVNDATRRRAEAGLIDWCAPDIFRAHADRALAAGAIDPWEAETILHKALHMAGAQEALAWELRTATSLARLWGYQGRVRDGIRLLESALARFREGFGDVDLISARALLTDLSAR